MKCDKLTPIELECNMGKDSVTGLVNREPWKAYDIDEVDAAIAELKAKLESVQASAYADSVDAGMRERRLRRALWLARAYRGRDNSILLPSKFMRNVWDNVERKCRAKAEEYK